MYMCIIHESHILIEITKCQRRLIKKQRANDNDGEMYIKEK